MQRHINALGLERFEIGVRDNKTGKMINRLMSNNEIISAIAWLKRMNSEGNDIYIRPADDQHALILLDDLNKDSAQDLKNQGYSPIALIETSPNNYQAWVRLSLYQVPPDVRRVAARGLATVFGADMNSTDSRHYGRLAGFTNRKPKYCKNGLFPFVLIRETSNQVARNGPRYINQIKQQRQVTTEAKHYSDVKPRLNNPVREYQRQAEIIIQRYGDNTDFSRLDWMISVSMAQAGFSQSDIEHAICSASPNVEERKKGHIEDYARRTAEKACVMK